MSEVGVIGQTYEDRRTKKRGKLVERDEKYKTLLMESDDGKSFNITYGGFKSNWRKVDEEILTVEEALQEVEVPVEMADTISVEPKKTKVKKTSNKKKNNNEVNPKIAEVTKILVEYVNSFSSPRLTLMPFLEKKTVAIKLDRGRIIEFIYSPQKDGFKVCSKEHFAKVSGKFQYVSNVKFHDKWNTLNYSFFVSCGNFNKLLNDLRPVFVNILSGEENE